MTTIIATVVVLGILIFVHELGHFLLAKLLGVRVDAFSLGFPPKLLSKKIGETEYRLSVVPLGGYVKLFGENPDEEVPPELEPRSFSHHHICHRALIVVAGPGFNLRFCIVALFLLFSISGIPYLTTQVGDVKSNYETGIFPVVQQAGVAALTGDQSLLDTMRRHFQRRRDLFADGLGRLGYRVQQPKATFYVWGGIPDGEPSARFAERLLDEVGVVVTPGAGFGPHGEGYFRAALTVDEARLTQAIARIGRITQ